MIQDKMPERVRQVEFSETQRISTGLTRVVKASDACCLFLEKGCVVVRELVEEGGKRVVKSVALPLNSGLVRTIHLEDEVLAAQEGEVAKPLEPVHDPAKPWASLADAVERLGGTAQASPPLAVQQFPELAAHGHPASCKCEGNGYLKLSAENGFTYETCPVTGVENSQVHQRPPAVHPGGLAPSPSGVTPLVGSATFPPNAALMSHSGGAPSGEEPSQHPHPQEQARGGYVPANAEEAILNRPSRRRR